VHAKRKSELVWKGTRITSISGDVQIAAVKVTVRETGRVAEECPEFAEFHGTNREFRG